MEDERTLPLEREAPAARFEEGVRMRYKAERNAMTSMKKQTKRKTTS